MSRLLMAASCALGLSAVALADEPPMPFPTYQMRAESPSGDRLSTNRDGASLYSSHCGECHLPWAMGSNLLSKQRMALGEPPESGLLVNRADLTVEHVITVVRQGKGAMPRLSRVDVTDAELAAIAKYLGKATP
jgi:mono/diheme cytochrome c family protein